MAERIGATELKRLEEALSDLGIRIPTHFDGPRLLRRLTDRVSEQQEPKLPRAPQLRNVRIKTSSATEPYVPAALGPADATKTVAKSSYFHRDEHVARSDHGLGSPGKQAPPAYPTTHLSWTTCERTGRGATHACLC